MSEKKKTLNIISNVKAIYSGTSLKTRLLFWVAIGTLFAFSFPIICNIYGSQFGGIVGSAVGSFHAVTEDMPAAYIQGTEDGLSAQDLTARYENKIREVGKLDVLAANAEITDTHKVGSRYAALYTLGADVVFSVDLTKASVYTGENQLIIRIPKPEATINLDSTRTRLEAEWQRLISDGSTEAGITAYINSMKKIQNDVSAGIQDFSLLEKRAEDSAVKQATMLGEMIAGKNNKILIQFEEKAGENT